MTTKRKAGTPSIAMLRRKLTAANKRADAATERLADLEALIAQRLNPPDPFDLWDEINKLCARAAATKAWQALAYETMCKALGIPIADEPPTLGRVLELIERLCAAFQRLDALEKEITQEQPIDQSPCEDLDGSGACFGCGARLGGDDDEPEPQEPQP